MFGTAEEGALAVARYRRDHGVSYVPSSDPTATDVVAHLTADGSVRLTSGAAAAAVVAGGPYGEALPARPMAPGHAGAPSATLDAVMSSAAPAAVAVAEALRAAAAEGLMLERTHKGSQTGFKHVLRRGCEDPDSGERLDDVFIARNPDRRMA